LLDCRCSNHTSAMKKNLLIVLTVTLFLHPVSFGKQWMCGSSERNPQVVESLNIPNLLYSLRRNLDKKVVCYQLNLGTDGELNRDEPIRVFWREPDGKLSNLNYLQNKLAYGVRVIDRGQVCFQIASVAFPERPMSLKRGVGNKYGIYVSIHQKECLLTSIFINIGGVSKLSPQVRYIELHGVEPVTGKSVTERIVLSRS
jgi:hypothetical protein